MRKALDHSQATSALTVRQDEIDAILMRLTAFNAELFDRAPDDITWADVATLGSYLKGLRKVSDAAFGLKWPRPPGHYSSG